MKFKLHLYGRIAAAAAILVLAGAGFLSAQDKGFGAGVIIGEPTGLGAKLWLSRDIALDFAAAWSLYRNDDEGKNDEGAFYVHADYLHHFFGAITVQSGRLVPYIGLGGKAAFSEDLYMGVRFPLGLTYMFRKAPVDIFVEISPSLIIFPGTAFDAGAGIGARYWFK